MSAVRMLERPLAYSGVYLANEKAWVERIGRRARALIDSDRADLWVAAGLKCHNYWRVETGQECCRGCGPVYAKDSGIGCRCGHRWFCW